MGSATFRGYAHLSHLTRGAWIETGLIRVTYGSSMGRTSHEVRGLKLEDNAGGLHMLIVAPHTRCVD